MVKETTSRSEDYSKPLKDLVKEINDLINDAKSDHEVLDEKADVLDNRTNEAEGDIYQLNNLIDLIETAKELAALRQNQAKDPQKKAEAADLFQPFKDRLLGLKRDAGVYGRTLLEKEIDKLSREYMSIGPRSDEIDDLIREVRALTGEPLAQPPDQPQQPREIDVANWPADKHPDDAKKVGPLMTSIATRLANEPDWNPEKDRDVSKLRTFLSGLKDAIADSEIPGSSRGNKRQVADFLDREYVKPAEQVLADVETRVKRLKNKEFEDWKQKYEAGLLKNLLDILNTGVPASQQDLAQQQQELRNQLSRLESLVRRTTDALRKQHLEKLLQRANEREARNAEAIKLGTEREEVAQYRQLVKPLSDAVDTTLDIDLANIAPHSSRADAHTKASLEAIKIALDAAYQAAQTRDLLNRANYDHNPIIIEIINYLVGENNLSGRHAKAVEHLTEAIDIAQRLPERERLENELEVLYGQIVSSEKPSKGSGSEGVILKKAERIREIAEEIGAKKEWAIKLLLWDAFIGAANSDVFNQLAWDSLDESRAKISGEVGLADMREFLSDPENYRAAEKIEELFLAGTITYVDDNGNPLKNKNGDYIGCLKEIKKENFVLMGGARVSLDPAIHKIDKGRGGTPVVRNDAGAVIGKLLVVESSSTKLVNGRPIPLEHDYGRFGNPRDFELKQGKLNIGDVLQALFPDLKPSSITGIQLMALIGELRAKAYAPHLAAYIETNKPTWDISAIKQASPMSYIMYKIRSFAFVPKELKILWQVLRLPTNDRYGTKVLSESTGERSPDVSRFKYRGNTGTEWKTKVKGDDNVEEFIEARELVDRRITLSKMRGIEVGDDLAFFPYIWDLILDRDGGDYGGITYTEYIKTMNSWLEFVNLANKPPTLTHEDDLSSGIGQIISAFSPLKGIYPILVGTRYYDVFIGACQEMILRYVKDIYDQYDEKSKKPTRLVKAKSFRDVSVELFNKAETFPDVLRDYVVQKIVDGTSLRLKGEDVNDTRLFSKLRGKAFRTIGFEKPKKVKLPAIPEFTIPAINFKIRSPWWFEARFNRKLKRYLREPSIKEQQQAADH